MRFKKFSRQMNNCSHFSCVFRARELQKLPRLNLAFCGLNGDSFARQKAKHESSAGTTTLTSVLYTADSHTVQLGLILTSEKRV